VNIHDAIHAQRAVRTFTDEPISDEDLAAILEAARRAPSSKNDQRWAFVVVRGRGRLRRLAATGTYADHVAGAAAAIALVTPETDVDWERESIAYDLGQATQNLMLAAWGLGIGSVHAAVYDPDAVRAELGLPADRRCDYIISLGYPASGVDMAKPRDPDRIPLDQLRHDETW
jgi:nitroreductase